MKYLLVHGLGASHLSFRTLQSAMYHNGDTYRLLEWKPNDDFTETVERAKSIIADWDTCAVVGHSLGGIIAWHVAAECHQVVRLVTVTAPFAGFSVNAWRLPLWFAPSFIPRMLGSIDKRSRIITAPRTTPSPAEVLNVVGTSGLFNSEPNDGVLTVRSQEAILEHPRTKTVRLPYTHMEILHSDEFVNAVLRKDVDSFQGS